MLRFATMILALILVATGVYWYKVRSTELQGAGGNATNKNDDDKDPVVKDEDLQGRRLGALNVELRPRREDAVSDEPPELLDGWAKPRVAFILTGEQHGYIEPCGCSEEQYGGMARRGDLIAKLKKRGWNVVALDLGGLVKRIGRQAEMKFEKTVDGLARLNYAALAMGPEDLRMPDILLSLNDPDKLPFLASNLLMYGDAELNPWAGSKVVTLADQQIGIASVMSKSVGATVLPKGQKDAAITMTDPIAGLKTAIEKMNSQIDANKPALRVLLSQCTFDETKELLKQFPDFDIVVSGRGSEEGRMKPDYVGDTAVVHVGQKGKYTGVLGYYDKMTEPVKFELVQLDRHRFGDDEKMIKLMQEYQSQIKQVKLADDPTGIPHPSGATFVGAEKCSECHSSAFEVWEKSKHAHAFESLNPANKRTGYERLKGIDRSFDPECIACHVTGWNSKEYFRYSSGFINDEYASTPELKASSTQLKGTQCESCHGPGSMHIELIDKEETLSAEEIKTAPGRMSVRITKAQAEDRTCNQCHDLDNSPKFKFNKYWPQIDHGLDE